MAIKMERGSGNVFLDMGIPPGEAAHLLLRSGLLSHLTDLIKRRKLSQKQAAKLLGVTQPRVSDLMRGKLQLFSLDTLVDMLSKVGMKVHLRVSSARHRPRHADAA